MIYIKNCLVGDILDLITYTKFQNSGVTILQGVEFSIFLLIFELVLQQCGATVLPVTCCIESVLVVLHITWGNGKGCPVVVYYLTDLQSLHGFRCNDNIASNAKCQ